MGMVEFKVGLGGTGPTVACADATLGAGRAWLPQLDTHPGTFCTTAVSSVLFDASARLCVCVLHRPPFTTLIFNFFETIFV